MQLPYFTVPPWTHYALLAGAVFIGHVLHRIRARQLGLDDVQAGKLSLALVIGAAYGAHWLALANSGRLFNTHPAIVIFPFAGGVSLGGLGGGFFAAVAYARWKRIPLLPQLEAAAWAFPLPWALLRSGCFLAHDSVGKYSNGPLALAAPGGPRHDLAFYEILWALSLSVVVTKWPAQPAAKLLSSYGILRAAIAPLRIEPSPLDWAGAFVLLATGILLYSRYSPRKG